MTDIEYKEYKIATVQKKCNCSHAVAFTYLKIEKWDIDNAVMSYEADVKASQAITYEGEST